MPEPATRERVLDALKPLGPVMARPALGGIGLHLNGSLFGVLHGGLVYLKVDKGQRDEFHAAGMRPLEPRPRQKLDAFLQVPQSVVDDAAALLAHAARAAGRPVPLSPANAGGRANLSPANAGESAAKRREGAEASLSPANAGESAAKRREGAAASPKPRPSPRKTTAPPAASPPPPRIGGEENPSPQPPKPARTARGKAAKTSS